ncbi:hypothetical protein Pcinc_027474 [Petrolisthes cinctipes]|uniref:Uncharacterized protein n=1 Tax=Petrolisthes cinctipes TaxID=88211 RepID=A0AAE1F545_PETCI|nr:hypothetical protein Pcinc_027474 [Petrolisthes cinctipes]
MNRSNLNTHNKAVLSSPGQAVSLTSWECWPRPVLPLEHSVIKPIARSRQINDQTNCSSRCTVEELWEEEVKGRRNKGEGWEMSLLVERSSRQWRINWKGWKVRNEEPVERKWKREVKRDERVR